MELRDLTYFLACLDEGHLTRAAKRLHVAQPTLSHAIARLEAEAGEALLLRPRPGHPRISATPAGMLLEVRARRATNEVQSFSDDLSALRGVMRGNLRIGSMQSLNSTLLPAPLARFALRHPGIQISLHTLAAEDVPQALSGGLVDVGLIAGAPPLVLSKLETKHLSTEELVAIARRDDPLAKRSRISLEQLKKRSFVMVLAGTFTDGLILEACRSAGFSPKILLRLESGEAIREVVRAGLGITILPAGYLSALDPTLKAVRLLKPTPRRDVHAVWDRPTRLSAAADAFIRELACGHAPGA